MPKEVFKKKIERIYEETYEQSVEDEYEFMTEDDMRKANPPFSEKLGIHFKNPLLGVTWRWTVVL